MKSIYLVLAAILILGVSASANSLWTPESKSLLSDTKAHQVGDTVTITVTESTSSTQKASSDFNKSLKHGNSAGIGPVFKLLPQIGVSSSQNGAAGGSTSKTMTFTATITAKVVKVLPNGTLQVEGTHHVDTNDEKQDISISGIVRPEDIDTSNSVPSTSIADLQIKCSGKGAIADRQKEGIISKLLKFLF